MKTQTNIWNKWKDKRVFIKTINNRSYSGVVINITDIGNGVMFISIKDRFGKLIDFSINEISRIEEVFEIKKEEWIIGKKRGNGGKN